MNELVLNWKKRLLRPINFTPRELRIFLKLKIDGQMASEQRELEKFNFGDTAPCLNFINF